MTAWPPWWEWELEFTPHLLKRMVDRGFNESDLRLMLDESMGFRENHEEGRFAIETNHDGRSWEVIVEPLTDEQVLLVITAYPLD
jgi:uncharacterized protein DUF4258